MPKLDGILETVLYVEDLERSHAFYGTLLGLPSIYADNRMRGYAVGPDVLLLFIRGSSLEPASTPGGIIPPHDAKGRIHIAFAIGEEELAHWEKHLENHGITIESHIAWPRGGKSLYFRDQDQNLLELATPGLWSNY